MMHMQPEKARDEQLLELEVRLLKYYDPDTDTYCLPHNPRFDDMIKAFRDHPETPDPLNLRNKGFRGK